MNIVTGAYVFVIVLLGLGTLSIAEVSQNNSSDSAVFLGLENLSIAEVSQNNSSNSAGGGEADSNANGLKNERGVVITPNQTNGLMTIEFKSQSNISKWEIDELKKSIVDELNSRRNNERCRERLSKHCKRSTNAPQTLSTAGSSEVSTTIETTTRMQIPLPTGGQRRRRRDSIGEDEDDGSDYTVDDVYIADVEQSGEVDKQYVTLYVEKNNKVYPVSELVVVAKSINGTFKKEKNGGNLEVIDIYAGSPKPRTAEKQQGYIWYWIPVVVILLLLIIIIMIILLCCRRKTQKPVSMKDEPSHDEEAIIRNEAPTSNSAPPLQNGHKQKNINDSWGCIIPYDELTEQERTSC